MLDDFILEQNIVYKIMLNSVRTNKVSHAYIIESNNYSKSFNLAIAFAKYICCPKSYTNNDKCDRCMQCTSIEKNEFLDVKIVNSNGMWIKKSELDEIQIEFSKKSIIGNKKIYIINNAEKLNAASSNSILKFLEEPEDGIIAILIVENISQLLLTIVSRCQILSLKPQKIETNISTINKIAHHLFNNENDINDFINKQLDDNLLQKIVEFIKYYEDNHYNTIIYLNKIWHEFFKERNEIYNAFTIIILFYKDVLNHIVGEKIEIFTDYVDKIEYVANQNQKNKIIFKINVIMNLREKIKYNINNNLLMDKLIIELEGCENV